jgi:hypothetical protein
MSDLIEKVAEVVYGILYEHEGMPPFSESKHLQGHENAEHIAKAAIAIVLRELNEWERTHQEHIETYAAKCFARENGIEL